MAGVLIPFAGLLGAVVLLWGVAFHWMSLILLAVGYVLTAMGVTVGYHRLFTHKSFETPKAVAFILAMLGSMAVEGRLLGWVSDHRRHHQHSDREGDPHSPHIHGDTPLGVIRGMFHAHVGWLFVSRPDNRDRYIKDLASDPVLRFVDRTFPIWVLLGLAIPALIGGLVTMSWTGALLGFVWGGLVRVFLVHHVTWSINSVCHIWGTQPFKSHDHSRNNAILGVLGFGEGWHNNHHAFPTSARHGLRWWELDVSYLVIKAMSLVGLSRNIKTPSVERIESKRSIQGAKHSEHHGGGASGTS